MTPAEAQAEAARIPSTLMDALLARLAQHQTTAVGHIQTVDKDSCHCNADDCEHCVARVQEGTELVLAAHEKLYPALREARELADFATPLGVARALKAQQDTIVDLVAMVHQLTAATSQLGAVTAQLAQAQKPADKPADEKVDPKG